ncbi:hypothetical protein OsJ_12271 [Oryza sativa Japonica Group]|uniref:SET domain-containing protein n=1 Tax=Oryza sativa subsp. japonica TaxID=39947 RepID=B9FAT8_ORYSJ|nr:hypothetical protein OsJ_12271 [Oryza sativa Japonica Group]
MVAKQGRGRLLANRSAKCPGGRLEAIRSGCCCNAVSLSWDYGSCCRDDDDGGFCVCRRSRYFARALRFYTKQDFCGLQLRQLFRLQKPEEVLRLSSCLREEWKLHQLECRAIAALTEDRKKMLTPTIRLMVRLVLRRKLQDDKAIPSSGTDNYNLVDALESHISEVDKNQLVLYAQMANLVQLILPSFELDLKEITHTFSKFACNAHTICDPELRPLGTGLYPVLSIINHSCVPNAVLIFEGRTAYVRALQPISKNEEDSEEDALLEGYRCNDQKCDGFLLPNADIYGVTRLADCIDVLQIDKFPVYERIYPPFHPMIGLQFYTCGKLEWLLEYTEDALMSLTRAADILRITHGTKSEFMKELLGKLEEVRAEASFRLSAGDEQ